MIRLLYTVVCVWAVTLLFGSQTNDERAIQFHIAAENTNLPLSYYWRAVEQDIDQALGTLRDKAIAQQQNYWLDKLMRKDGGETAWRRYLEAESPQQAAKWLKAAALQGVAEAQFQYSLTLNNAVRKEQWLIQAAEQNFLDAQIALADWYLLQGEKEKAVPWLEIAVEYDTVSQVTLAKIYWNNNQRDQSRELFERAAKSGNMAARKRLAVIKQFTPLSGLIPQPQFSSECLQNIVLVANGLEAMVNSTNIANSFSKDARFKGTGICVSEPIWLDNLLDCSDDWLRSGRLGCNLSTIGQWVREGQGSHLVIVGLRGKANVQSGVMYIDALDAYSVFVHELAHFAGFVDEYRLPTMSANAYCGNIRATNLLFEQDNGFMLDVKPYNQLQLWQSMPEFSGLFPAATCEGTPVAALKPAPGANFLQHHEIETIPAIYMSLWKQVLKAQSGTRPVLRYLSTNNAVAPHTATGITTKFTSGINDATLTHIPNETLRNLSSLSI